MPFFGSQTSIVKVVSGHQHTGLAIGNNGSANFLYAADFANGKIDVFDQNFNLTSVPGNFADATIPSTFHPYNIQNLGGSLYVTYGDFNIHCKCPNNGSGYVRKFVSGHEQAEAFQRMAINGLGERPDDFAKEGHKPEEMNWFELHNYVERLRASGARVENYVVDLHLKLAFPLICLIVVIIGGALSTRLRMQGAALGFGLSVAISFLYYGIMRAGQALGHNGALPPYIAAWSADALFGSIALVMMAQAQRR